MVSGFRDWWRGRELSRVEVVAALWRLPVIRPPKPESPPKVLPFRNLILYRGERRKIVA